MAKKKSGNSETTSKKVSQDNLLNPMQSLYSLIVMMGVVKENDDLQIRYSGTDYNVSLALPRIKYAIAFYGDKTTALEEDGWHIEHVNYADIEPFSKVFFSVQNSRIAELYSRADPNVKQTSIPEEKLLAEMRRRNIPIPDRNYRFTRDDGKELTVPDFTWEDYNIVFFMDGSYWHSVKDDQALIKEIKSSRKMTDSIVEKRKDKVRKDNSIRSELAARGWTVLSCTDDDLETPEGTLDILRMIERAMETVDNARKIQTSDSVQDTLDILGDDTEDTSEPKNSDETVSDNTGVDGVDNGSSNNADDPSNVNSGDVDTDGSGYHDTLDILGGDDDDNDDDIEFDAEDAYSKLSSQQNTLGNNGSAP